MDNAPKPDLNDIRSYPILVQLRENAESLGIPDFQLKNLRSALEYALAQPEGEVRELLLRVLHSALMDKQQRRRLSDEVSGLKEQLKAESPALAEVSESGQRLQCWTKLLRRKYEEAVEAERKKGVDVWSTAWAWYGHELYCYTDAMSHEVRKLERSYVPPVEPEAKDAVHPDI